MPTANWLAAASKYDATPILVFRLPDRNIYWASKPGHYPVAAAGEPHHAGIIAEGGMPKITREISGIFEGRIIVKFGSKALVDNGNWDGGWDDYKNTIRGAKLEGYVTFDGLDFDDDAELYLTARIKSVSTTDKSRMTLELEDAANEEIQNAWVTVAAFTGANLGDLVKQALIDAGLAYTADFDTTFWNAWIAANRPGSFTVTGLAIEGQVFDVIEQLTSGTHTVFGFNRSGKFIIQQFADITGTPTPAIDYTTADTILEGGSLKTHEPVIKKEIVKWNAGASEETKEITGTELTATYEGWLDTARENEPVDLGLTLQADAIQLAGDRLLLRSAEHALGVIPADSRLLAYDVLAVVKHNYAKHHLPNITPQYHQVYSILEDPEKGAITALAWTSFGAPPQP